jgi:hypothetical protein
MYAMLGTRPDIAFAVTALSQFCSNPGQPRWTAVNRVLHYLRGMDYKLTYGSDQQPLSLYGYCDSDWASDKDDRRSVTGYASILGGGAVSWQAKSSRPWLSLPSRPSTWLAHRPPRRPCGAHLHD